MPARVQVDNSANQRTEPLAGGVLGALGGAFLSGGLARHNFLATGTVGALGGGALGGADGSLVPGQILVPGVTITLEEDGQSFNSAQVGKLCKQMPRRVIVIETSPTTTRVQANTSYRLPTVKT